MEFLESYSESVFVVATLATATLAFFIIKTHFRWFSGRGRPHIVAGTVLNQMLNYHRLHDYMADLARKHKTFRVLSFLRSEGSYHYSLLTDLLGDGIFAVDGDKWRHQRNMSSYEISTKIVRDFSIEVFKSNAVKLAGVVSEASMSNTTIDVQDSFLNSTLDTVFKIVLGVELDTMYGTYEEGTKFSRAFDSASEFIMYLYVDIFWKIKRFFNIGSEAELRKSVKVIDEFVYKLIRNKIEQTEKTPNDLSMRKGDLISRFLEMKETDSKYLRDIIFSFMIAGRDTTATTLSWFLYMLCKNPHVQEKIALEVEQEMKLKNDSIIDELAASITEETLEKMHYLHATLTETLRLYPVIPTDGKTCLSNDTLPDGFSVRKESPFKFTAFQAGPRICLGKDFAYRQMKILAAVLLYGYNFKLADPKKSVNYRIILTLFVKGGLHLQASKRLWPLSS